MSLWPEDLSLPTAWSKKQALAQAWADAEKDGRCTLESQQASTELST